MRILAAGLLGLFGLLLLFGSGPVESEGLEDEEKEVNLLVNGSFEEGLDLGRVGITWLNEGSTDLTGWTVTKGQISIVGETRGQPADGKRYLDLHGAPGFGGIKQTFKTKKGQKYRVTFSMAASVGGTVLEKKLGVAAAGKSEKFVFDATDKTRMEMGWTTQVWDFEATAAETTLEFYTLMTEDGNYGPALDKVTVTPVEE